MKIGNNEFFQSQRGAKTAGTRRGYREGAKIISTDAGYCLLDLGEGADSESYKLISSGDTVAELTSNGWRETILA